jgi:hypothetical protein
MPCYVKGVYIFESLFFLIKDLLRGKHVPDKEEKSPLLLIWTIKSVTSVSLINTTTV